MLLFTIAHADPAQLAEKLYLECAELHPNEVRLFEQKHGQVLYDIISAEFPDRKHENSQLVGTVENRCLEWIGTKYGTAKFNSRPLGARILVEKDPQLALTPVVLRFPIGKYDYRIELNNDKFCTGYFLVESNKQTAIPLCK